MTITYTLVATLEAATSIVNGVPTFNQIQLFTCDDCGSVVRANTQAKHTSWHAELGK